jgi:S-adenosylmethionine hydrolase
MTTPRTMRYDWISFTTDYGLDDGFVAACHGVIATIAPAVRVIDVAHTVPPQEIRRAAAVLRATLPFLPPAVHILVVDPGVGTARRPVVAVTGEGDLLVGPDNGLLPLVAESRAGIRSAHQLTSPSHRLPRVSATFHGRDIFAPAAAHLALGVEPRELGPPVEVDSLVRVAPSAGASVEVGSIRAEVQTLDRFGNIQLNADAGDLGGAEIAAGDVVWFAVGEKAMVAAVRDTFANVPKGRGVLYLDSVGLLSLAVNGGSAAEVLGASPGDTVSVSRVDR